jgi:hypothetical protein
VERAGISDFAERILSMASEPWSSVFESREVVCLLFDRAAGYMESGAACDREASCRCSKFPPGQHECSASHVPALAR